MGQGLVGLRQAGWRQDCLLFRATEEFPADDSGHGFDNIGNVLTVSHTLMQKHLSSAEQIASAPSVTYAPSHPLPRPGLVNRHDRVRKF